MGVWTRRFVKFALVLAIIGVVAVPVSALGTRLGLWPVVVGLGLLAGGVSVLLLALVAGSIGCLWTGLTRSRKGLPTCLIVVVIGVAVAYVPVRLFWEARSQNYPPIHDITTDTEHAPEFVAVLPLRGDKANSVIYDDKFLPKNRLAGSYGGKHFSEVQAEFYPDIQTLILPVPVSRVFDVAVQVAEDQGWEIVAVDPQEGRIEATATTFWFGFKDDVVIRLVAQGGQTRLDMRSSSRVGMSDFGVNAKRVRAYLAALSSRFQ